MSLFCPECHSRYDDDSMRVCPSDGTRLYEVDDSDPLVGTVIDGRFRVDYTLGIGGMGTVYGGVQLSVNRDVAIKVLRTELANREVALERFFREAKTISGLTHPNIVSLIDFGQDRDRGVLYLVMELVKGHNLAELIGKGRLRTPLALEVAYQVCGALTEPHAAGVIHRDLKPDNLLLVPVSDGTMQAKVLDFGIARFMESNTQLTGTGMICGTPAYMAPEQAQNETLDARTDLYALGVIMYEMLSGWPPFSGTSSLQVMLKHIQENPPKLRDLLPPATLPSTVEDLVYSMISKERPLRPKNARVVRDAIDDIRRELGLEAVRLDISEPDFEGQFDPFILHKLPRPDREKSGPTQVLRRETGLEEALKPDTGVDQEPADDDDIDLEDHRPTSVWKSETSADEIPVTGPLTPDGRIALMEDARRVKVETRGGGQQAWTPGDQRAVRSIKDTKEGVDALGATVDAASAELPARRTMVEDNSEPIVGEPPNTHDAIEPVRAKTPNATQTRERHPANSSNLRLAVVAILGGIAAVAAAVVVIQKIDDVVSKPPAAVAAPSPSQEETKPKKAKPADPKTPDDIARVVEARVAARSRVRRSMTMGSQAVSDGTGTAAPRVDEHGARVEAAPNGPDVHPTRPDKPDKPDKSEKVVAENGGGSSSGDEKADDADDVDKAITNMDLLSE